MGLSKLIIFLSVSSTFATVFSLSPVLSPTQQADPGSQLIFVATLAAAWLGLETNGSCWCLPQDKITKIRTPLRPELSGLSKEILRWTLRIRIGSDW